MQTLKIMAAALLMAGAAAVSSPVWAGSFSSGPSNSGFSQNFKSKQTQSRSFKKSGKRVVRPKNTIRSLRRGRGIGFNGGFDFRGGV